MATETVEMDDKALFDAATSDAPPAETQVEQTQEAAPAETEQPKAEDRPRDEHGRFAPKEAEPAEVVKPQAEPTQQPDNGAQIPAWRVSEIAEARRAAEARATENERRAQALEAENRRFQQQLQQLQKPPAPRPDMFENPDGFVEHGVRQALDPVQQRMDALREHYSWKDAMRTHGTETAIEARKWFQNAVNVGDPNVSHVLQRAMNSIDPFEDIVSAYKQHRAITTVGHDPEAWLNKELAERAKDPAKRQQLMQMISGGAAPQQQPSEAAQQSVVKLPPSLTRAAGSSGNAETGSLADADLYAHATR